MTDYIWIYLLTFFNKSVVELNLHVSYHCLNMVSKSDDPALFLRAIGHIARSKGMSQIAEKTGLGRESLYKALDEKAHPRFETIFKVLNAMGIQMTLVPKVKFRKRAKQTEFCVAEKRVRYRV